MLCTYVICMYIRISRLTVVSCEAKEEVPCDGLSTNVNCFVQHQTAFFYMRECVTHENNLNTTKLLQQSFSTPFTKYMTHLPSLVVFRGLVSEYWHYQIQTSVSPLKYRISFFYRIPRTDFKLCKGIFHLFSFDLILCIAKGSTWITIKLIGRINLFMLYISDKFHHQNQQQKSDISHFTLMFKSFHTCCRLYIVPTRFVFRVAQ